MKQILYTIVFIVIIDLSFQNCANPGRPSGGPSDTIPPVLIFSSPKNGTTNFTESVLELEFSEFINADQLRQQLIITPSTDILYKSVVKRNKLLIKLDGELDDSTTYNFNFANSVTDITERNPSVNLSLAFSTGPVIDSMTIMGTVENLLNKQPCESYLVGLYPFSDSLDFFTDKPLYFTTTNDSGRYELNYIKNGIYKILSFEDLNGNLLLDPETEPHGFISENIQLDTATNVPTIRSILQNVKPLSLINARPTGRYVEVKFNKYVSEYAIYPDIYSNLVGDNNDVLRLYKPSSVNYKDSVTSYITASDSLGNQIQDTIKYVFLESNRKPSTFSTSASKEILLDDNPGIFVNSSKPILHFDSAGISVQIDSLLTYVPTLQSFFNANKTRLDVSLQITETLIDSLIESISPKDSILNDSTIFVPPTPYLVLEKGTFISIENDTSSIQRIPIIKEVPTPAGVLNVDLNTTIQSFWFQLLDQSNNVKYQIPHTSSFTLPDVTPGTYTIRILIDSDNDGKWSYGNLLNNEEPEEVFIYEEKTSIRENWVIELPITF